MRLPALIQIIFKVGRCQDRCVSCTAEQLKPYTQAQVGQSLEQAVAPRVARKGPLGPIMRMASNPLHSPPPPLFCRLHCKPCPNQLATGQACTAGAAPAGAGCAAAAAAAAMAAAMDNPVVMDYGSDTLKAGYSDNMISPDEPCVRTPCAVYVHENGMPHQANGHGGGSSTYDRPPSRPVAHGRVVDFDQLESLMHYALYELLGWQVGGEGALVVAEPVLTSRPDRELLCQLLFEVFNVAGAYWQVRGRGAKERGGGGRATRPAPPGSCVACPLPSWPGMRPLVA